MKPSKEIVQKYQQQQNNTLLSNSELNNDFIGKQAQHSTFSNLAGQSGLYSDLNTFNQLNSTNKMANSIFSSKSNEEDAIRNFLNNVHHPQFNELLQLHNNSNGHSAFNPANSSFNPSLIAKKKAYFERNNQMFTSMLNDSTFTECDLSDEQNDDEEYRDSEEMSEDEQPLDFSTKSKKDDDDYKKTAAPVNSFLSMNRPSDQIDSGYPMHLNLTNFNNLNKFNNLNNLTNSSKLHSNLFNHLNATDSAIHYATQLNSNGLNQQQSTGFNPFMNHPLALAESQLNNNSNLMHSEPSSPEGLSSASSTSSSRSSSQGYYSGSSFNGNLNIPNNFNVNGANSLMKPAMFTDAFNQSSNKSFNNSMSFLNQKTSPAALSYDHSESYFKTQNKLSFKKNSSNQTQLRPSVIVSNAATTTKSGRPLSNDRFSPNMDCGNRTIVNDSVDEHFRLSLGSIAYNKMINSQSTPTKDALKSSGFKKSNSSVHDHYSRSSSSNSNTSTVIESATSVDDHFAKALGETWFKLNKDKPAL